MDFKELVFKIETRKYDAFKKACKENETIPATALKKFMKEYVAQSDVAEKPGRTGA